MNAYYDAHVGVCMLVLVCWCIIILCACCFGRVDE